MLKIYTQQLIWRFWIGFISRLFCPLASKYKSDSSSEELISSKSLQVGAISVSGLKTITIRNLALARRSLQLVTRVLPAVKSQFIAAPVRNSLSPVLNTAPGNHLDLNSEQPGLNNNIRSCSSSNTKESKQFNQAASHLENHVKELDDKILW